MTPIKISYIKTPSTEKKRQIQTRRKALLIKYPQKKYMQYQVKAFYSVYDRAWWKKVRETIREIII